MTTETPTVDAKVYSDTEPKQVTMSPQEAAQRLNEVLGTARKAIEEHIKLWSGRARIGTAKIKAGELVVTFSNLLVLLDTLEQCRSLLQSVLFSRQLSTEHRLEAIRRTLISKGLFTQEELLAETTKMVEELKSSTQPQNPSAFDAAVQQIKEENNPVEVSESLGDPKIVVPNFSRGD